MDQRPQTDHPLGARPWVVQSLLNDPSANRVSQPGHTACSESLALFAEEIEISR